MTLCSNPDFDNHEKVLFWREPRSGLHTIIAIHSTALGPAAGGCRMWKYPDNDSAFRDALRLSRAMSYKNTMAELPLGGGKAVIIGDSRTDKTESMLEAFGDLVDRLRGEYITAEDVGLSMADMEVIARRTRHVSGLPRQGQGAGGNPAPKTARGVFLGIRAALAYRTREPDLTDLSGFRVAVQGLGNVGYHLCRLLHEAGAGLIVADIDLSRARAVADEFSARVAEAKEITSVDADVLAPCALGAVLDADTISGLHVSIVAGAANNQLATPGDGHALMARDILYAPDYVINAGGIINVAYEHLRLGDEQDVDAAIARIPDRLNQIFALAAAHGEPTSAVADRMAQARLDEAARAPRPAARAA